MAEFLETEAIDIDSTSGNENDGEYLTTVSDEEFIDDSEQSECSYFTNVTKNYNDVIKENMAIIENCTDLEARHYFDSDEEEQTWNEFSRFEAKVKLFKETLICPHGLENRDSFFIRFFMQFVISLQKK